MVKLPEPGTERADGLGAGSVTNQPELLIDRRYSWRSVLPG